MTPFFVGWIVSAPAHTAPTRQTATDRPTQVTDAPHTLFVARRPTRRTMAFTFFFRDSQTLELAIDEALPRLCGRAFIHVWDAGCAHGPEPYTLAILLRERMSDYVFRNVRIHATDLEEGFAAQVASGVFAEAEVQRVPPGILEKYFRRVSAAEWHNGTNLSPREDRDIPRGFVEIVPELRAKVTFSRHDLLSLRPPREDFSLIVCKNVLLHFDPTQRVEVLRMFHDALQPGGTLVMEATQKLPESLAPCFEQVAPHVQVYRKVEPGLAAPRADEALPRNSSTTFTLSPHRVRRERCFAR